MYKKGPVNVMRHFFSQQRLSVAAIDRWVRYSAVAVFVGCHILIHVCPGARAWLGLAVDVSGWAEVVGLILARAIPDGDEPESDIK